MSYHIATHQVKYLTIWAVGRFENLKEKGFLLSSGSDRPSKTGTGLLEENSHGITDFRADEFHLLSVQV